MKTNHILALAGAIAVASPAMAYDMIHPFYAPSKGEVTLTTMYNYENSRYKRKDINNKKVRSDAHVVTEQIAYGLTSPLILMANVQKSWADMDGVDSIQQNLWTAGAGYVLTNDDNGHFVEIYGDYGQAKADDNTSMVKFINAFVFYGYNFDWVTPHVKLSYHQTVNKGSDNDATYNLQLGMYKKLNSNWGVNIGAEYEKDTSFIHSTSLGSFLEVGYIVNKQVSVLFNTSYEFYNNADDTRDYDKWPTPVERDSKFSVGAKLKINF